MNPFLINSPTCISFSGGRTSAFMLYKILEVNGGLPNEAIVCFANTGKECEETLEFVRDCEDKWDVPITWIEYCTETAERPFKWVGVDYISASREGEPFDAVIQQREPSLPNGRSRYCSSELKTRTMHRYLKHLGWTEWDSMVGIRADEPRRVAKFRANTHPEGRHETVCLPLAQVGISAQDVGDFWKRQSFDLKLPNHSGKTMHGNCDLCYLKPKYQVLSLIAEKPERAIWWANHEEQAATRCAGDGQFFAIDRPSYLQMANYAKEQADMFDHSEEAISCFCGD